MVPMGPFCKPRVFTRGYDSGGRTATPDERVLENIAA